MNVSRFVLSVMNLLLVTICFSFLLTGCSSGNFVTVRFPDGTSVLCEIADSPKQQIAGLSTYDKLPPDRGMIFVYQTERPNVSFWMPARMKFNIDFLFLNAEKKVIHIVRNAPPCKSNLSEECPSYGPPGSKKTQYVVEVVAGFCDNHGIKINDTLEFQLR